MSMAEWIHALGDRDPSVPIALAAITRAAGEGDTCHRQATRDQCAIPSHLMPLNSAKSDTVLHGGGAREVHRGGPMNRPGRRCVT